MSTVERTSRPRRGRLLPDAFDAPRAGRAGSGCVYDDGRTPRAPAMEAAGRGAVTARAAGACCAWGAWVARRARAAAGAALEACVRACAGAVARAAGVGAACLNRLPAGRAAGTACCVAPPPAGAAKRVPAGRACDAAGAGAAWRGADDACEARCAPPVDAAAWRGVAALPPERVSAAPAPPAGRLNRLPWYSVIALPCRICRAFVMRR